MFASSASSMAASFTKIIKALTATRARVSAFMMLREESGIRAGSPIAGNSSSSKATCKTALWFSLARIAQPLERSGVSAAFGNPRMVSCAKRHSLRPMPVRLGSRGSISCSDRTSRSLWRKEPRLAADYALLARNLREFYDFADKVVLLVGAGHGTLLDPQFEQRNSLPSTVTSTLSRTFGAKLQNTEGAIPSRWRTTDLKTSPRIVTSSILNSVSKKWCTLSPRPCAPECPAKSLSYRKGL